MNTAEPAHAKSARNLHNLLAFVYGPQQAGPLTTLISEKAAQHRAAFPPPHPTTPPSQRDALLITYADQVREPGLPPLRTLASFCQRHLAGRVSGVHILPFYPWTSDDGFSVKDYFAVAPEYGSWDDIAAFRPDFDLMMDAVFNHMSSKSAWFEHFCQDDPAFRNFFVTVAGSPDLSQVVRPRALPLLTAFPTARGIEKVWTTFSDDQVDLNAANPKVLLALLDALLFYAAKGARFIRLDAIAYLWKEIGTPCIHLPQTHALIRVMRAALDLAAPQVQLITETNVPHADNISYFGNGHDEAQMVYNFALPPLALHALLRGDASHLARWASSLTAPSPHTTFFNFLASHDGIGVNPVRGILPQPEIDFLVASCRAHGGFINEKHNADGSRSPYEMNIVYFDALNDPAAGEPLDRQIRRFLASQAIMLALAGVPGIYFHSLFGSRNDRDAAIATGINRRINRQKLDRAPLEQELADASSLRSRVFRGFAALLDARRNHPAFAPHAPQRILEGNPAVFAILRTDPATHAQVLCLHNVTANPVTLDLHGARATAHLNQPDRPAPDVNPVSLDPYETAWLSVSGPLPNRLD